MDTSKIYTVKDWHIALTTAIEQRDPHAAQSLADLASSWLQDANERAALVNLAEEIALLIEESE